MFQARVTIEPIVASAEVNGAELYHEIRGNGPPILFIAGATGDGGMFQQVAERLADEFTVVTYHRRGNSLSPPPEGWTTTTIDEQADDAAALLRALDLAPAVVFGNSLGAGILLNLMLRHPETLIGAIVHEPVLAHVVPSGAAFGAEFQAFVETGLATVGPRETMERFIRMVAGDENFEHLGPELRERMLGNAEVFFFAELPAAVSFTPDAGEFTACEVAAITATGIETPAPIYRESAEWAATQLGTSLQTYAGAHTPYLDHPDELAGSIRTFAHEIAGGRDRTQHDRRPAMRSVTTSDSGRSTDIRPLLHEVTGAGDPIILVPGILTGWASWQEHAERLAEHHTVVRVQMRSVEFAAAGTPIPETYGIDTERDALLATVDALGLDRFDLAGWSLGGGVSLAFALEYPERVRTLTLIEPEAAWVLRETGHAAEALSRSEEFDRAYAGRDITIDDLKAFLVRAGLGALVTDIETHPRWPLMVRNRQSLATIGAISGFTDSLDRLRALTVPILAVRGTDSTETDIAMTEDIAAVAPNTTLLILPGDHACFLQNPDRFIDALEAHIAAAA